MRRSTTALAMLLLFSGLSVAHARQGHPVGDQSSADQGYMRSMQRMRRQMPKHHTGNADKDFVRMMLPHHRGADGMAKVELRYGKDPQIRSLARQILKEQAKQEKFMKKWLESRSH